MLAELLNNIDILGIALAVVLLIGLVIYKISKKSSSENVVEDLLDIDTSSEENKAQLLQDEYDETQDEVTPQETLDVMDTEPQGMGSEEGDFGVVEDESTPEEIEPKTIQKRDVPPHGKITKENFKEFDGQRILLAEDNLINQKVILGLLADSGIDVVVANDGQEALNILQNDTDFTVILMDAHMPNIDGFEATRRIRENPDYNHIVVVALSGDTASDDIRKMTEAGMSEHLEKPLKMDALYDILYAYNVEKDKEASEDSADTIRVISTKELDGEKGLDICGGDETFYHEILSEFLQTYNNSDETLIAMLEAGELKKADKLLLDIVGVSANIGAQKLHNVATQIKDSLSDTQEKVILHLCNNTNTT